MQSSRFTYGHRRVLVVGTGPGEDEPEVTDRVLPLRVWRSVLLFSSVMKTQAGKHRRASNLSYRTGQTDRIITLAERTSKK